MSSTRHRRAPVGTAIEVARRRLRRGYRLEAAELLDRCVRVLHSERVDDPALIERLRYAHDRCTGNGRTNLAPDVLERAIRWVTREELYAGEQALAAGRPFAAARFMIAADRIDDRGSRSAFLHATALFRAGRTGHREQESALRRAERCFRRASTLMLRAYADPALRLECDHMNATIEAELARLSEDRALSDRMAAACACLVDYDAFAPPHDQLPMLSPSAQAGFRSSLAALSGRIDRLLHRSPGNSAEARLLTTLAGEVAVMRQSLMPAATFATAAA